MQRELRNRLIGAAVLLLIGGAAAYAVHSINGAALDKANLPSDVLFAQASVTLLWAFIRLIGNFHVFTFASYGFKQIHAVMTGKPKRGSEMKEDYLAYRNSRPVHTDAGFFGIIGVALLVLSGVVTLI